MWKRNGQTFANPLTLGGLQIFNPSAEQLRSAGYRWTDEDARVRKPVRRYSALKIIRALGDGWGAVREALEKQGYLDQFLSANCIREDDKAFIAFADKVPFEFLAKLDECLWTSN